MLPARESLGGCDGEAALSFVREAASLLLMVTVPPQLGPMLFLTWYTCYRGAVFSALQSNCVRMGQRRVVVLESDRLHIWKVRASVVFFQVKRWLVICERETEAMTVISNDSVAIMVSLI